MKVVIDTNVLLVIISPRSPFNNKFVDCAIAASAELLISHDGHFRVINQYPYLNINLLSATAFQALIA